MVKKFPHVHTQDTIIQHDTIRLEIPKISVDTMFEIDSFMVRLHDTITLTEERLKIKMYAVHDSVYIEGSCDTIFVEKIIEREIPIRYYETKDPDNWKTYLWWGLGIFLLFVMLYVVYKIIKLFK
mgnify:CR=1 FL=1